MAERSATVPPGVDDPAVYRYRSGGVILPREANWLEGLELIAIYTLAAIAYWYL